MNTYLPKSSTISSPGLEPEHRPSARSITSHTNQRLSKAHLDAQKSPAKVHNSTFISEKEMRLDKQFQDLVKRCNQSKAEIEKLNKTLFTERLNISPKFEKSKDFSLQPVSAYSMILSPPGKINFKDSVSNKSTSHFESFQPYKKEEEPSFLKTGRTNLNAKQPSFSIIASKSRADTVRRTRNIVKGDTDDEDDSGEEAGMHTAENLKELKMALNEQKRAEEGQLRSLEIQYEEIKHNLNKYISRVDELEELHKKKDKQLRRLDEQVARKTKDLTKKEGVLRECEQMKGVLRENSDDLESLNVEYSIRLSQQSKTLGQLEQVFEREKENHLKDVRKARDENRSLRREIDLLRARENILIESNKSLKEDIEELKPKLTSTTTASHQLEKAESSMDNQYRLQSQHYNELSSQNKSLKQQLEELETLVEANGDRLVEINLRSKEEKRRLKEEGSNELVRKKEQISELKREIRECEHAAVKTKEESRIVDREIQAIREQKGGLEKEREVVRTNLSQLEQEKKLVRENIEKLRSQNGELQESRDKETAKIQKLTDESNKVRAVLESLEAKVGYKEKILREAEENHKLLKEDKELLFKSTTQMREDIAKLRNKEEIAKVSHKDDATLTDKKVDALYNELKKAGDDNTAASKVCETLRREILEVKNQRAEDDREIAELKEQNKFLKNCIAQGQEDLEIAIQQKRDRVEKKMKEQQERAYAGEKIRILNEIQDKIDRFRVTRQRSDSD